MFIIKTLTLRRVHYYAQEPKNMGPLEGEIELVSGNKNKMELHLTAEQTQHIMSVIAEALVESAQGVAAMMTQQVIEQTSGEGLLALGGSND